MTVWVSVLARPQAEVGKFRLPEPGPKGAQLFRRQRGISKIFAAGHDGHRERVPAPPELTVQASRIIQRQPGRFVPHASSGRRRGFNFNEFSDARK